MDISLQDCSNSDILELLCMCCKAFMSVLRELNELVYYLSTHFTMNFKLIFFNKLLISLMVAIKSLVKGLSIIA